MAFIKVRDIKSKEAAIINTDTIISLINVPFRAKVCQLYAGVWKFLRAEAWMR